MKRLIKFFTLIFTVIFMSCSSDEDNNSNPYYFNFKLNSTPFTQITYPNNFYAQGGDKYFKIGINSDDGMYFHIIFDKNGKLIESKVYSLGQIPTFVNKENYFHYRSHYFYFDNISINETTKTISGNFYQKLYSDKNNLDSDYDIVEGDFYLSYDNEQYSNNQELIIPCNTKLNETDWFCFDENHFSYPPFQAQREIEFISNDDSKFKIGIDVYNSETGLYNFDTSTYTGNYIKFYKYNINTLNYDEYDVDGSIEIISRNLLWPPGFKYTIKFDLTANHQISGETINISDGNFTFVFSGN